MSQEVKLEAEKSIEPGPSAVDHEETETDKHEDEMESSEDEDSEDDSDNPDDYLDHRYTFCCKFHLLLGFILYAYLFLYKAGVRWDYYCEYNAWFSTDF